jgi:phosphoglycolate phosphatase-like HAD superfamily hydrolase
MRILLFDMDGVLLHARGYHRGLMETVRLIGTALGFRHPALTQEMIDTFEANGITSEWESAAICTALMLRVVWRRYPDLRLPEAPPLPDPPAHDLAMPDILAFLQAFGRLPGENTGVERAEELILTDGEASPSQEEAIRALLEGAHRMQGSLTHRIFQELVLGGRPFREAYGLEPYFDRKGMLVTEDRPALTGPQTDQLRAWMRAPGQRAAVFTNRPSEAPQGFFDTPEAEIGLQVVGLEDLPVIGHGGLTWLGARLGLSYGALLKPSPVHILAALQRTLGAGQELALLRAAALALEGNDGGVWEALDGAEVSVFEDAAKGIRSAVGAAALLSRIDRGIRLRSYGVSGSPPKALALRGAGARVFPTLQAALVQANVLK